MMRWTEKRLGRKAKGAPQIIENEIFSWNIFFVYTSNYYIRTYVDILEFRIRNKDMGYFFIHRATFYLDTLHNSCIFYIYVLIHGL